MDTIIILIIVLLPLISQTLITSTYNKYSKIESTKGLTGKQVARKILDSNGLKNVSISEIGGTLTDHYSPKDKHINLSTSIYNESSISSISVAAHEVGHAIQDKEHYSFLVFRSKMVPIVNFSSRFATIFIVLGFMLEIFNLVYVGIALLSIGLIFQLITLPVEFDASRRAKIQLQELGIINQDEINGTNKVLGAAAFTYVANFLASALQIARLIINNKNRR